MDETSTSAPPERHLTRSDDDKIIAGVAGGLGQYFGVDAVLFRIAFVALTVAGGSGLLLYGLGWLVLPEPGDPHTPGERVSNFFRRKPVIAIIATVIVVSMLSNGWQWGGGWHDHDGGGFLGLVLLVLGIAFLVNRSRNADDSPPAAPPATTPPEPTAPAAAEPDTDPLLADAFDHDPTAPDKVWPPLPPGGVVTAKPRRRPFLTPVVISLLLIGAGVAVLVGMELQNFLAIALLVVGAAMLVGAWRGRARGLIAIGLLLTAMATLTSVTDVSLAGGTGERSFDPVVTRQLHPYRLGVGELRVDLRNLQLPQGTTTVRARVGIGSITVLVPPDVPISADTHVGLGQVTAFGRTQEGSSIDRTFTFAAPTETAKHLRLDLDAGVGEISVEAANGPA